MQAHVLHRYPRWGDELTADAPTEDHKFPVSVPADTTPTKSHDEGDRDFERTLAASKSFDHLGDISNLSASVQKLLRDFATDSDELTKCDSSSMLQPLSLPVRGAESSDEQVDHRPRPAEYDAVSLSNIAMAYEDESPDVDAGTATSSQLATMPVSIVNTLPLKADVAQVIIDCDFLLNFLPVLCCLHTVF